MSLPFASLPLSPELHKVVAELGFKEPTPIQAASIPLLYAGHDVIAQARTGSGKTVAFALPLLDKVSLGTRALQALVLCPTRELSAQVARELRKIGRYKAGLHVLILAGGEPLRAQANALERGVHIAVGTPGRVMDHLRRRILQLDDVAMLVLDEADRMLEMGFEEDMQSILSALPKVRQTALFSATYPDRIDTLSKKYQRNPQRIESNETEAAPTIRQLLVSCEREQKQRALKLVLSQHEHESALIFANQKVTVAELAQLLQKAGISCESLHGDLEQFDRDKVLAKFRNQSTRVLVATDVAARGLDVSDLDLVVNYELPVTAEVYVHRVGRTGRAGKSGLSVSLVTERDQHKIKEIKTLMPNAGIERISLFALASQQEAQEAQAAEQPAAEASPASDAAQGATASDAEGVAARDAEGVAARSAKIAPRDAKMDTLRISGGRKQKMRPGDILGALTGEAGGLQGDQIGKIEIHDNFSYVAVAKSVSQAARKSLSVGRIKGKKFIVTLVK